MKLKPKTIIVGSNGQDGQLLAENLKQKGYQLFLVSKENCDITNAGEINHLISEVIPDEIYFLAAYHHSSEDPKESDANLFKKSFDIHVLAAVNFLEAIALKTPTTRFFYASSSHIFSAAELFPQNEKTVPRPESVYAITKYSGMLASRYYREQKNLFASCGILFNHESSLRSPKYLSRKVAIAAAQISHRKKGTLILGDLDSAIDWGYAPDYVEAMHRILQVKTSSDYVISSGKTHTVRQFIEIAFNHIGLDYRDYVQVRPDLLTRNVGTRIGDPTKLKLDTGWTASTSFEEMVTKMVNAELKNL